MSNKSNYIFVDTTPETIASELVESYEEEADEQLQPGSPEKVLLDWIVSIIIQERSIINYIGNQNLPSRASGSYLDALGELFFNVSRPVAAKAVTTEQFTLSAAQTFAITIPQGTRVTDANSTYFWTTDSDLTISAGSTTGTVTITCMTAGASGNGYTAGQINQIVDTFQYFSSCRNTETTSGGSDAATDTEYFELMQAALSSASTAGAKASYIYLAKSTTNDVGDVVVNSPSAGEVRIYALTKAGAKASTALKALILANCNAENTRPLTDHVQVIDPTETTYNIEFTFYADSEETTSSSAEITAKVSSAVDDYVLWQSTKFGRGINPDKLRSLVLNAGAKRLVITSPTYTALSDGSTGTAPEVAKLGTRSVTFGGFE